MDDKTYDDLFSAFTVLGKNKRIYFTIPTTHELFLDWLDDFSNFSEVEHRNFYFQDKHLILCPINGAIESNVATADMYIQEYEDECKGENGPPVISFYARLRDPIPNVKLEVRIKYLDIPEIPQIPAWVDRLLTDIKQFYPEARFLSETQSEPPAGDNTLELIGTDAPWLQIPDNHWDRTALEMWIKGYPVAEIASQVGVVEDRVRNRITELRNTYKEPIVPYRRSPQNE